MRIFAIVFICQVLNLFLALLLSSFGAESFKHSDEEEGPNKLQEAIDRINRFTIYTKSHILYCVKVCRRTSQNPFLFNNNNNNNNNSFALIFLHSLVCTFFHTENLSI